MSKTVISVENISKEYRLGTLNYRTFFDDVLNHRSLKWLRSRESSENRLFFALKNISFKIEQGESVAIVGRNGAGKTTLARIISEIIYPSSGTVRIKGRTSTLGTGVGFSAELTARDNIFINGAILGMKRKEIARRFDEIIDFAEIPGFVDTPIKRYSTGMKSRLVFSTAIHFVADILIIDEGLGGGDLFFKKKAEEKINRVLKDEGRTIIMVNHSNGMLRRLCTRGILLDRGEFVADDRIQAILERYESMKAPHCKKTA